MFLRILKKDLKRKKSMNVILFLFIVLASMFVASGLNNVLSVWSGTEYYLNKAGIDDYVIITMGEGAVGCLDDVLDHEKSVEDYRLENVIYGAKDNLTSIKDEELITKNSLIFQSISSSAIHFFNLKNEEIKEISEGHAYVSGSFFEKNDMKPGDKIKVKHSGVNLTLTLDGKAKDALLGSDFMGNTRILLNEKDYQKLLLNEEIAKSYQGQIAYVTCNDTKALSSALSTAKNIAFPGSRDTIKMCYVMDMVIAFVVVILSICLILVSFVVLKFSINFTIGEEFREIGVMKAIGIKNGKIRSIYIAKYTMLAVTGAFVGLVASVPFGTFLMKSVSNNMVLGNSLGYAVNYIGAAIVILVILLFAYGCTRGIKKLSPVDAVRQGQTGERYKKRFVHHIGRNRSDTALQLAVNDVITNPKRFVTIIISFFICTLFTLITANTTNTMKSDKLIETFGVKSDIYFTDINAFMKQMHGGSIQDLQNKLHEMEDELANEGMPCKASIEVQYQYGVEYDGKSYSITCQQGCGAKADEYKYEDGQVPQNGNEIAITPQIMKLTGAKIGDKMVIDFGGQKRTCLVTATYQTMNKLGEVIRLHQDAPVDLSYSASMMAFQFKFTDHPSEKEILKREEKIKKLYHSDDVKNATEYCMDCVGVADTMQTVQYSLLGVTLIVVLLVTVLMERSFVADEKSQIAILKAIGFKDRQIIRWHIYRFGIVSIISVILAALVSIPMTYVCVNPIFGMMGATDISYNFDVLEIFVVIPTIVFAGTVIFSGFSALHTKEIKSSDTANIE